MSDIVEAVSCPKCGGPLKLGQENCRHCGAGLFWNKGKPETCLNNEHIGKISQQTFTIPPRWIWQKYSYVTHYHCFTCNRDWDVKIKT
jgi:hypothetical protein